MPYTIQRTSETWPKPGRYRSCLRDGKKTAVVACPECSRSSSLSGHSIASDGEVSPSLVCPYDECDFHEWVVLENWTKEKS